VCVNIVAAFAEKPKKSLYITIKTNRDKNDMRKEIDKRLWNKFMKKIMFLFHYSIGGNRIFCLKAHVPVFLG